MSGPSGIRPNHIPEEKADAWERAHKALQLRRSGMLWDEVAKTLGYKYRADAYRAAKWFMKEYPREDAEALRDIEADRLEQAQHALWQAVLNGVPRATEVWIKLSERRSKLLGIDAPDRKELTVLTEDAVDKAIREAREEMERTARAAGVEVPTEA